MASVVPLVKTTSEGPAALRNQAARARADPIQVGGTSGQRVQRRRGIRVGARVKTRHGINHRLWPQGRGGAIEVGERMAIDLLTQSWELAAPRGNGVSLT